MSGAPASRHGALEFNPANAGLRVEHADALNANKVASRQGRQGRNGSTGWIHQLQNAPRFMSAARGLNHALL